MSVTQRSQADSGELRMKATAVSRGVGIGPAVILPPFDLRTEQREIATSAISVEVERLTYAVERVRASLRDLACSPDTSEPISGIFDTHLLILESFADKVVSEVRSKLISSEWAIDEVLKRTAERQASVTTEHLREKQVDLKDVAVSVLDELRQTERIKTTEGAVVVTRETRPSYVMEIARSNPAAIVSRRGGWTSHSAILARELGIPMVTGVDTSRIHSGDLVRVDGFAGEVILRPESIDIGAAELTTHTNNSDIQTSIHPAKTTTSDNVPIRIRVNKETLRSYETAVKAGALGIGLFRSESLIPRSGKLPSEDRQCAAYSEISEAVGESGVQIRTFDVGPEMLNGISAAEQNPALGLRSIRLSLSEPGILITQLRALLRANTLGNISVVIPMVSGIEEILRFREILNATYGDLLAEGVIANLPKLGAMIEVPSAVLTVRDIAREVDFLCLGTNDLVQYLLAVDRDNDAVADWYQTLHPAVLRAIREVIDAGIDAGIPVTVCGEMAGSPFYVPLLIGLGVRDLSMRGNSIIPVRNLLKNVSAADAKEITETALLGKTASEIDSLLRSQYIDRWHDLFGAGIFDSPHP